MSKKPTALEKRNAEFNALSPLKKRVAVAKDVLLQIKLKKIIPTHGEYGCLLISDSDNLQTVLKSASVWCECCAKGAAVMAKARLGNDVYGMPGHNTQSVPNEIFGNKCARILECVFESWSLSEEKHFPPEERLSEAEVRAVNKYMMSIPLDWFDGTERMRVVYQNFITNRGHFVVPGKRGVKYKF